MSNIKEVIINPNKPADVKFVQYDTGQKLYVKNSPDFDFTNTTEIQITDGTESAARYRFEPYGDGGIVALPDTMFRNAGILKGYIFSVDANGHTTEALISIGIRERPVYNEYISDADEEVVIPAGFEVIQNPESVTIKAYNTDGTVTEGTVNNGSDGEPGAPGERGSDGISPEASIEQTATGAIITVKDARGATSATLENGHDGNDGISPTAKVEQTAGGAKVTITDRNGTTTANLTNGQPGQPGTTVIANPEGDATDTLNKLQVGNSIYSIPSGGGGGASGPIAWVETSESSPATPYRTLTMDAIEAASGQSTITAPYTFFDEDAQEYKRVNVTIVASYNLPATTQKIDTVHLTENITSSETTGTAYPTVSVDSISFDDAGVESYSSISLVNPSIASGKIYAFLPQTIEFVYNQRSVSASYNGEFLRQQVGTYQHTQTAAKYALGTQS